MSRWGEKAPGVKILWVWTFGTAAILITSVVRTRLNDMEKILRQEEDQAAAASVARQELSSQSQSQPHHTDTVLKD